LLSDAAGIDDRTGIFLETLAQLGNLALIGEERAVVVGPARVKNLGSPSPLLSC